MTDVRARLIKVLRDEVVLLDEEADADDIAYADADAANCADAIIAAFPELQGWQKVAERQPPPHRLYEVSDGTLLFHATPCYGMHMPWWVPRNGYTRQESEPIAMAPEHRWRPLPAPPAEDEPASSG